MTTENLKEWIGNATLRELQDAIRNEPVNSPLFTDETGDYFWNVYRSKIAELYKMSDE